MLTSVSCEKNATLSPQINRIIASEHLSKTETDDDVTKGVKDLLMAEQDHYNHESAVIGSSLNLNPDFSPEKHPKFPLPYFLVPEDDASFIASNLLDPRVSDQLIMRISGKKHYKLFVHPAAEAQYDFLRYSYSYIGADQTEFFASPLSNYKTLVIWNRNNNQRKPFIAKISLDKTNLNEIDRAITNQKALDRIGEDKLSTMNFRYFPDTFGITLEKKFPGIPEKIRGQIISEIPDEIVSGEKKWLSFSAMMNTKDSSQPLIIDIIKKSNLSSYDFFKTYMINNFLEMYGQVSLQNGFNIQPLASNFILETNNELVPTGKWAIRDLKDLWPDIINIAKSGGPYDVYMQKDAVSKYQFLASRTNYLKNYAEFYKKQIFNTMLEVVAKYDPSLTEEKINLLKEDIDTKYIKILNKNLGLNIKSFPGVNDFAKVETDIQEFSELDNKMVKREIKDSDLLQGLIDSKKDRNEWIQYSNKKAKSEFYLTNHGLYEISNRKIIGLAFFNLDELADYRANNQMLPSLTYYPETKHDKSSCYGIAKTIIIKKK